MKWMFFIVFNLLSLLGGGVWSLRNLTMLVPRAALSGESAAAVLRCEYDLEGAALYSIRWYRAETEFYRYVPRESQYSASVAASGRVFGGVWSLRNLTMLVPRAALSGESAAAVLRCEYDLEGAALYSIRWYRAETEFYRYVPREMPPTLVFPLPGATVDLAWSDAHQVRIVGLHRRLSGQYQCEVSADAPLFHTEIRSAPLTIVDPPFRAPRLWVGRASYVRGDVIAANCSVDEAYPAPNISWIIDEHKIAETVSFPGAELDWKERGASSQLELIVLPAEQPASSAGLALSSAALNLMYRHQRIYGSPADEADVLRYSMVAPSSGSFSLRCVSSIFDVYARTSPPVTLREDSPLPASVTGDDSSGAARYRIQLLVWLMCVVAL